MPVEPIVERVLAERLDDGGWNCEVENGSVRSSFDTTMNVLDGLLEFEGSSELSMVRAGSVGSPSISGKHDPQPIMIKISEAVGEPADLFVDQVDGFGATVGDA